MSQEKGVRAMLGLKKYFPDIDLLGQIAESEEQVIDIAKQLHLSPKETRKLKRSSRHIRKAIKILETIR